MIDLSKSNVQEPVKSRLENFQDTTCPCCGRYCKVYKRALHAEIASLLVALYKTERKIKDRDWFHITEFYNKTNTGREFCIVEGWGLAIPQRKKKEDTTKRTSGYWQLTELGRLFVEGVVKIPKHIFVFDNVVYGASTELVDIRFCLQRKFDYNQLMRGEL